MSSGDPTFNILKTSEYSITEHSHRALGLNNQITQTTPTFLGVRSARPEWDNANHSRITKFHALLLIHHYLICEKHPHSIASPPGKITQAIEQTPRIRPSHADNSQIAFFQ
jgi:hypothetical protein